MKTIIGYLLLIVSFLGIIFFRRYSGTVISYPIFWYILFLILGLFGVWLLVNSTKRAEKKLENSASLEVERLKAVSEKIELNFDFCEFKNGSYSHQVDDKNTSSLKLIALGSSALLGDKTITENVVQSSLIYTHTVGDKTEKYISQSFPFDQKTLGYYVLNNNLVLYVDRVDRTRYFFDLKK